MLKAGKELAHYTIHRKLGSGGMADVYEAQDQKLGRRVALKVLPPELTRNPELVARFQTEVRAAASLNHRSIVTVFEVGEANGVHFYSMRLLTGGDLRGRIKSGLRPIEALAILRELTGAFEHAHGRGFVHRDVKPENVLFDEEGLPVLTDFGIAKALGSDSNMTATGVAIGTPRYFSPEQARGRPVDARSDLYSLGVILYEMLTGAPPYTAEDALGIVMKHVNDPIPRLPDEHAQLQPLLDQLMAKDPEQRTASARDLRKAISGLGGFAGLTPQPINLGEESELVQRLLSGEAAYTPAPGSAPAAAPGRASRALGATSTPGGVATAVVADAGATVHRSPPPRPGAGSEQIIPYRRQLAAAPKPTPAEGQSAAGSKPLWRSVVTGVGLLAVVAGAWLWLQGQDQEWGAPGARTLAPASAVPSAPPTGGPDAAGASVSPPGATEPATAAPASKSAATVTVPPKTVAKPAPTTAAPTTGAPQSGAAARKPAAPPLEPKPAPVKATTETEPAPPTVPSKVTDPEPRPAAQKTDAPETSAGGAEVKPEPDAAAPAPTQAADPERTAPASSDAAEEDEFLRRRAEQLRLERERREAKAAERQGQAKPADGGAAEPVDPPE